MEFILNAAILAVLLFVFLAGGLWVAMSLLAMIFAASAVCRSQPGHRVAVVPEPFLSKPNCQKHQPQSQCQQHQRRLHSIR